VPESKNYCKNLNKNGKDFKIIYSIFIAEIFLNVLLKNFTSLCSFIRKNIYSPTETSLYLWHIIHF